MICIDTMVTIGGGDVTQQRLRPAQRQLRAEGLLRRAAYLDILPCCPFTLAQDRTCNEGEHYFPIEDRCLLPLDELARQGLLGPHVLALVCTPTPYHALYATQLLGTGCCIAVEKPFTQSQVAAKSLLPFGDVVFPVGHQLFKAEMLHFLARCRMRDWVRHLTAISFDLWEAKGVGRRAIDNAVWDLGWHGFECILAPLRAAGYTVTMSVTRVRVATYAPPAGELSPVAFTAACIEGCIHFGDCSVPYRIRVGKGLAEERKQVVFWSGASGERCVVSLQESGWQAHYRLLHELLTSARPDLKLSLADTVTVVHLCAEASRLAVDEGTYPFGTTPDFLQGDVSWEARLDHAA